MPICCSFWSRMNWFVESNALLKSTNATKVFCYFWSLISAISFKIAMAPTVFRPFTNPNWNSGKSLYISTYFWSLLFKIAENTLYRGFTIAMDLKLFGSAFDPFLCMKNINNVSQDLRTVQVSTQSLKMLQRMGTRFFAKSFKSQGEKPSSDTALLFWLFKAIITSSSSICIIISLSSVSIGSRGKLIHLYLLKRFL